MKSVCISYNFSSRQLHDEYVPVTDKDVTRFMNRFKQDKVNSPASDLKAFRLYEDGRMEKLE